MSPGTAALTAPAARRVPELDGIRGAAIALVLIFHYLYVPLEPLTSINRNGLVFTWSGVDLFFVLSGYLIGGILVDNRESPHYFAAFYMRRFARIFPLYFAWFGVFCAALAAGAGSAYPAIFNERIPVWSYAVFVQNFVMSRLGDYGPHWMNVTWSLAIEEQFYLALPLMIWFLPRRALKWAVAAAIALSVYVRWTMGPGMPMQVFTPARLDGLALGVGVALVMRAGWKLPFWLPTAMAMVSGIVAFANPLAPVWLSFLLLDFFYATVLFAAVTWPGGPVSAAMRLRPLRWLGGISYGVYLIHQAVYVLCHAVLLGNKEAYPRFSGVSSVVVTLFSFGLVLAAASLSNRYFERPILERAHRRFSYGAKAPVTRL